MTHLLPQFYPSAWKVQFDLVGIDFAEGVCLGFVERRNGSYGYLNADEFSALGVTLESLLADALAHLGDLRDEAKLHVARPSGATVVWITAEDNFAAVRMLTSAVMAQLKLELGEHFLFCIPSRDQCLFWNQDAPRHITDKHAGEAAEDLDSEDHNLTPQVFVYSEAWPCLPYGEGT